MPPKKDHPDEKKKAKVERERRRRAKIKADPVKYAEYLRKEKERRQKRKAEKKILLIGDLTPRHQRAKRKEWRDYAKIRRAKKKTAERAFRPFRENTPSTDSDIDPVRDRSPSPSIFREDIPLSRCSSPLTPANNVRLQNLIRKRVSTPNLVSKTKSPSRTFETPCTGSPSSVGSSVDSALSRQKLEGLKRVKESRDLARFAIHKQAKIIKNQRNEINTLKKKIQRLIKTHQIVPTTTQKKQKLHKESWHKRKNSIEKFLEDEENSMISPALKDTVTRKKIKKQKRFLCDSLENLHKKYNAQVPQSYRVSYASFCRLRPFWILRAKLSDRDTCMCVLHENFKMILERLRSLNILRSGIDVIENVVCDVNSYACMSRKCEQCSRKSPLIGTFENDEISYHQWINKNEERNIKGHNKTIRRTVKARLIATKKDLVEKFLDYLPKFLVHKFNISNQHKTLNHIKEHLKEGEVLIHIDFSENFSCKYFTEAQSVHFGASRQQVSIHSGVLYYLSETTGKTEPISFCSVSPCLRHDAAAVFAHLKKALLHINRDKNIKVLHVASDGPSSQYKNKNNFYLFTQHLVNILHVSKCTWNFSESSHGKGPADGVGAAVKGTANNHVLKGNDIPGYETFVQVIKEQSNVLTLEVSEDEIKEGDRLLKSSGPIKNLHGIKKMHQLTWTREQPKMISMRELTCIDCGITDDCSHFSTSRKQEIAQFSSVFHSGSSHKQMEANNEPVELGFVTYEQDIGTSNKTSTLSSKTLREGVWVLAKFLSSKKQNVLYVGQIIAVHDDGDEPLYAKFTRKRYHNVINGTTVFIWKEPDDFCALNADNIIRVLPEPTPSRRGELIFDLDFSGLEYPVM